MTIEINTPVARRPNCFMDAPDIPDMSDIVRGVRVSAERAYPDGRTYPLGMSGCPDVRGASFGAKSPLEAREAVRNSCPGFPALLNWVLGDGRGAGSDHPQPAGI